MAQISIIYGGMVTFLFSARAITHRSNFHNNSILNWLLFQLRDTFLFKPWSNVSFALMGKKKKKPNKARNVFYYFNRTKIKGVLCFTFKSAVCILEFLNTDEHQEKWIGQRRIRKLKKQASPNRRLKEQWSRDGIQI